MPPTNPSDNPDDDRDREPEDHPDHDEPEPDQDPGPDSETEPEAESEPEPDREGDGEATAEAAESADAADAGGGDGPGEWPEEVVNDAAEETWEAWNTSDESSDDGGADSSEGGEGESSDSDTRGAPADPSEVDSSYRNRGRAPEDTGPRNEPDPNEPLELNFEHGDPTAGSDTSGAGDGDFSEILDEDSREQPADGDDNEVDVEEVAEELREEMGERDDGAGGGADDESTAGAAAAAAGEDSDGGDGDGDGGAATAGSGSATGTPRPGGVLATSLESPATSDEILDELEEPELSGVERVAEGVVDAADQVAVGGGSDTSRLDRYAYRRFGPWVRAHADWFAEYREEVNEARLPETYDEYLSRVILWSLLFTGAGVVVGSLVATTLVQTGVLAALSLDVPVPSGLTGVAEALRLPVAYAVSMAVTGGVFGGATGMMMYSYPSRRADQREREIDYLLPQVVTYMYALSQGQLSIPAIIRQVARDEDTYGEVAREFQAVVNEMDYRGRDLRAALRAARTATPSEELAILLDDMINVESTGGKLSPFFEDKVEKYQHEARRQKKQYLDTLEQFAELYVTLAAVMVFIITIAAIYVSITGNAVLYLALFLYVALPLLSVAGWVMIDSVSLQSLATTETLRDEDDATLTVDEVAARLEGVVPGATGAAEVASDGGARNGTPAQVYSRTDWSPGDLSAIERTRLASLQTALRRQRVVDVIMLPVRRVQREPLLSLVFSAPVALLYLAVIVGTGYAAPTATAFTTQPAWTTTATVVVPLVILLTPISVFHELDRRRDEKANAQLPGLLRKLAAATDSGATLSGAIAIVANSSDTYLARELRRAHVESSVWNVPRNEALVRMTDRVRSPRVARVFQLITQASGSTEYLRDILEIAAQDVRNAHRMERDRKADMQKYMFIIIGANVAFLVISIILAVMIVPRMQLGSQVPPDIAAQAAGPTATLLFGDTPPTSLIQMFFMHGAVILGLSSGLLAGKLGDDDVLTGVKIAIAKIVLVAIAFLLV